MAKFLQEILGENYLQELLEVYTPFPEDERRFYEKHGLELGKEGEPPIKFPRFPNMYSETGKYNADHLFNGVIKVYDREKDNYGYSYGKDAEHYESYNPQEEYVDEMWNLFGKKSSPPDKSRRRAAAIKRYTADETSTDVPPRTKRKGSDIVITPRDENSKSAFAAIRAAKK